MFSEVFIAEDVDGVRDKRSIGTMAVDVQTLLEVFFFLTCPRDILIDEALFW